MVRYMRRIYQAWLVITSAAIVVQLYLAGYGVFAFNGIPPFDPHLVLGDLIGLAILVGVGLAFAARVPWRLTWINIGLFVLMFVQATLAHTGIQSVSALHVVNGVLIFIVTLYLTRETLRLPSPVKVPAGAPVTAMDP